MLNTLLLALFGFSCCFIKLNQLANAGQVALDYLSLAGTPCSISAIWRLMVLHSASGSMSLRDSWAGKRRRPWPKSDSRCSAVFPKGHNAESAWAVGLLDPIWLREFAWRNWFSNHSGKRIQTETTKAYGIAGGNDLIVFRCLSALSLENRRNAKEQRYFF